MTPTARIFNELLRVTARAYDLDVERLTTEERMPAPRIREARQVVMFIGSELLGLTTRQLGQLMQRDAKAAWLGSRRCRRAIAKDPLQRRIVQQLSQHIREYVRTLDVLHPGEAAE
jgi:chromosomal replication initiation ATPase DnaA